MRITMTKEIMKREVVDITTSCGPVSTGHIANGGWNWSYPAIGKVAGTAGNLEKWVTGYEDVWEDINDPSKEERSFRWGFPVSKETAWKWLDSQAFLKVKPLLKGIEVKDVADFSIWTNQRKFSAKYDNVENR